MNARDSQTYGTISPSPVNGQLGRERALESRLGEGNHLFELRVNYEKEATVRNNTARVLGKLVTYRQVWVGLEALRIDEIDDTELLDIVEDIARIQFGERRHSILMRDDYEGSVEFRLHRDISDIELEPIVEDERPPVVIRSRKSMHIPSGSIGGQGYRRSVAVGEDSVRTYIRDLYKTTLLTKEQEVVLALTIRRGKAAAKRLHEIEEAGTRVSKSEIRSLKREVNLGEKAKEQFIEANLRLVVSIAKRFASDTMPILEHIQNGNLGLIRAVEKFDPDKGFKFSTYATWWIRQFITRGIAETSGTIRVNGRVRDEISLLSRTTAELHSQLKRPPTVAELERVTGFTADHIARLRMYEDEMFRTVPLDALRSDDSDSSIGDMIANPNEPATDDRGTVLIFRQQVRDLLDVLDDRSRQILEMRYGFQGDPMTLEAIGQEFNLSRERVRQVINKAKRTLLMHTMDDEYSNLI